MGLDLAEGDFQLVQAVHAGFVDAGMLAGRADEQAAEEVREAGMVVPESDQGS